MTANLKSAKIQSIKQMFIYNNTYVHCRTRNTYTRHGKIMGSMLGHGIGNVGLVPDARLDVWQYLGIGLMLGPNRVIAKDVKGCTYRCSVRCATLIVKVGWNALAPKQAQLITMHSQDLCFPSSMIFIPMRVPFIRILKWNTCHTQ